MELKPCCVLLNRLELKTLSIIATPTKCASTKDGSQPIVKKRGRPRSKLTSKNIDSVDNVANQSKTRTKFPSVPTATLVGTSIVKEKKQSISKVKAQVSTGDLLTIEKACVKTTRPRGRPKSRRDKVPTLSQDLLPQDLLPQDILPQDLLPQDILPQDLLPQDILSQGLLPPELLPQNILPQDILPQEMLPQDLLPPDLLPQDILPQDLLPLVSLSNTAPSKLHSSASSIISDDIPSPAYSDISAESASEGKSMTKRKTKLYPKSMKKVKKRCLTSEQPVVITSDQSGKDTTILVAKDLESNGSVTTTIVSQTRDPDDSTVDVQTAKSEHSAKISQSIDATIEEVVAGSSVLISDHSGTSAVNPKNNIDVIDSPVSDLSPSASSTSSKSSPNHQRLSPTSCYKFNKRGLQRHCWSSVLKQKTKVISRPDIEPQVPVEHQRETVNARPSSELPVDLQSGIAPSRESDDKRRPDGIDSEGSVGTRTEPASVDVHSGISHESNLKDMPANTMNKTEISKKENTASDPDEAEALHSASNGGEAVEAMVQVANEKKSDVDGELLKKGRRLKSSPLKVNVAKWTTCDRFHAREQDKYSAIPPTNILQEESGKKMDKVEAVVGISKRPESTELTECREEEEPAVVDGNLRKPLPAEDKNSSTVGSKVGKLPIKVVKPAARLEKPTIVENEVGMSLVVDDKPTIKVLKPSIKVSNPSMKKVEKLSSKVGKPATNMEESSSKARKPVIKVGKPVIVKGKVEKLASVKGKVGRPAVKIRKPAMVEDEVEKRVTGILKVEKPAIVETQAGKPTIVESKVRNPSIKIILKSPVEQDKLEKPAIVEDKVGKPAIVTVGKPSNVKGEVGKPSVVKVKVGKPAILEDKVVIVTVGKPSNVKGEVGKPAIIKDKVEKPIIVDLTVEEPSNVKGESAIVEGEVGKAATVANKVVKVVIIRDNVGKHPIEKEKDRKPTSVTDTVGNHEVVENEVEIPISLENAVGNPVFSEDRVGKTEILEDEVKNPEILEDKLRNPEILEHKVKNPEILEDKVRNPKLRKLINPKVDLGLSGTLKEKEEKYESDSTDVSENNHNYSVHPYKSRDRYQHGRGSRDIYEDRHKYREDSRDRYERRREPVKYRRDSRDRYDTRERYERRRDSPHRYDPRRESRDRYERRREDRYKRRRDSYSDDERVDHDRNLRKRKMELAGPRRRPSPRTLRDHGDKPQLDRSVTLLSWYDSDLHLIIDPVILTSAQPMSENAIFANNWAGARATYGARSGKVAYEVYVTKTLGGQTGGLQVGWSALGSTLQLGEASCFYGYDSSGLFVNPGNSQLECGPSFKVGDVVTALLDMDSDPITLLFCLNRVPLNRGMSVRRSDLPQGAALFPHVISKCVAFGCNFGGRAAPWFPVPAGYTLMDQVPLIYRTAGPKRPESRTDCELVVLLGSPDCDKTEWALRLMSEHPEKHYYMTGNGAVIHRFKDGWLPDMADPKREKIIAAAASALLDKAWARRRNCIYNQTSVSAREQHTLAFKFRGFMRTAVVLTPGDAVDVSTVPHAENVFLEVIYPQLGKEVVEALRRRTSEPERRVRRGRDTSTSEESSGRDEPRSKRCRSSGSSDDGYKRR